MTTAASEQYPFVLRPIATLADLAREPGKAELIAGKVVRLMPTGHRPNLLAGRIYRRLADYVDATGHGHAYTDSMGFAVPRLPSGRESFSPDAAYYSGPLPANDMRFVAGPPTFAVEVRSENDFGPASERELAEKRADYFAAGTLVVWDVDPLVREVRVYRPDRPEQPRIFVVGDDADAEAAVPGWRLSVAWLTA